MRIILANHHLRERAGSELYTSELARGFIRRGHEVGVFTFIRGPLSEELERSGVRLFGPEDGERIEAFDPDVLHVHHAPCLYALGAMRLRARVVFSSLGVLPVLEAAPSLWAGVGQGLAVSEEVRGRLEASPFGRSVPLTVFRNWFDDTGRAPPKPAPKELRRLAVVSNHLDDTLRAQLDTLVTRRAGFEWVHFGLPRNSIEMTAAVLEPFDAVITIGRTALLAASLGKPVLLLDVHGCDGWLTAERLPELARCNFSGRLEGRRLSLEALESELFDAAPRLELEPMAAAIWRDYRLSDRLDTLLALYRELQAGPGLDEAARASYGRTGEMYLLPLRDAEVYRGRVEHLARRVDGLRRDLAGSDAECARLRAELDAEKARLQSELDISRGTLAALQSAMERMRREMGDVLSLHEEVVGSASWQSVSAIRQVKDRVFPKGTQRRHLYDRALERLKRGGALS